MKKMMKKLIAMAAALVMIVTLLPAVGAKAAGEPPKEQTITQDSATLSIEKHDSVGALLPGANFKIYKVASLDTTVSTQLSYKVEEAFIIDEDTLEFTDDTVEDLGNLSASGLENLATKLAEKVEDSSQEDGYKATNLTYTSGSEGSPATPLTINKEDFGIYLVVETEAPENYAVGAPFLVDIPRSENEVNEKGEVVSSYWDYSVVVTPKNGSTQLTKTVTVDGKDVSAADVKIGDTISYKVAGYLPYLTKQELNEDRVVITISDTLTGGLSFKNADSESILNLNVKINGQTYTVTPDKLSVEDTTFTITIDDKDFITKNNGKSIELTYDAYVKNISYDEEALNEATISFNDDEKSDSTIPEVYTYAIAVRKMLGDTLAKEGEVQFELYSDLDCTTKVGETKSTNNNGEIIFDGLDAAEKGTIYYLKEVKTAQGYTLLANPIAVTLKPIYRNGVPSGEMLYEIDGVEYNQKTSTVRLAVAKVTNNKGFSLPETGGMGTYLFTIGGIVIMAGAAFALIAMKKRA